MTKTKKTIKKVVKKAKLTKEQTKIVAILKDALAQLKAEVFVASTGIYVDWGLDGKISEIKNKKEELKKYLPELVTKQKPCEVCAKGAIFLSGIRKFNNFTVGEAQNVILDDVANYKACDLVGSKNADKMEIYFERWYDNEDETGELVEKWEDKYPEPHDRLVAILKNAIKYKGTFTPEKEKF